MKNADYTAAVAAVELWLVLCSEENSAALLAALEKTRGTWIQYHDVRYRWSEAGIYMERVQ